MPDNDNMGSYMDSIGPSGIAAARLESMRMARELEDKRIREEQAKLRERDLKSREETAKRQKAADDEKRARLQAESDAIVAAQLEEEKARAKRAFRAATGSESGFDAFWSATEHERVTQKIAEDLSNVPTAQQVWRGDVGARTHFTPMQFPN